MVPDDDLYVFLVGNEGHTGVHVAGDGPVTVGVDGERESFGDHGCDVDDGAGDRSDDVESAGVGDVGAVAHGDTLGVGYLVRDRSVGDAPAVLVHDRSVEVVDGTAVIGGCAARGYPVAFQYYGVHSRLIHEVDVRPAVGDGVHVDAFDLSGDVASRYRQGRGGHLRLDGCSVFLYF